MKNKLHFFAIATLLLLTLNVNAQVVEFFGGFGTTVPAPEDSFSITVTNTDSASLTLYPLTVFEKEGNLLFTDKQTLYNHLSTNDQFGFVREFARLVKSPYIVHCRRPEYTAYGVNGYDYQVAYKQFSPIPFFLSNASHMCGERQNFFSQVAVETGMISVDSLLEVSTVGHTLGEWLNGKPTLLDFDDGEPRFMDKVPGTVDEYMSAQDIIDHPEWLDSSARYCYEMPDGKCRELTRVTNKTYSDFFTQNPVSYFAPRQFPTADIDGKWKLLPGQSITINWNFPTFVIDSGDSVIRAGFNGLNSDTATLESAMASFGIMFPWATDAQLLTIFKDMNFAIVNGATYDITTCNFWKEHFTVSTHIPAQNRDIIIGTDMRLPMQYISSTASGPFTLGAFPEDTVLQNSSIETFNPNPSDNQLQIESKALQYIQAGRIPAGTTVDMKLRYNNLIYKFPNGFRAEMFGADSTKVQVVAYPAMPTGIASLKPSKFEVSPNPNNGNFTLISENADNLTVDMFDVLGTKLKSFSLTSDRQQIHADVASGVYFLKSNGATKRIVIQ